MKIANKVHRLDRPMLRTRVYAAFGKIASAVDQRTAYLRTQQFFRSSGSAWTRSLG